MKFEIFKVGAHTSDKGVTKDYSLDDLNFIAESYKPDEDEAPIVIGHPEDNDPAFGWISSLSVTDDGKLIADAQDEKIHPEFLSAVKEGSYKKRSISLTPDGKLRHIGFLGAAKPSVKGLSDIQFSSPSSVVYEMEDLDEPLFDKEEKNEEPEIPEDKISELSEEINHLKETISSMLKTPAFAGQSNFSETELNSTKESIEKINSQLNVLQSKISNSDFENLLEKRIEDGTLTPAVKDKVLAVSNFMLQNPAFDGQSQNFSEDFSQSKFQSDVNKLLVTLVNSFPNMLLFENFAEKPDSDVESFNDDLSDLNVDEESKTLHRKAVALMKKDNLSYLGAVTKIMKIQ